MFRLKLKEYSFKLKKLTIMFKSFHTHPNFKLYKRIFFCPLGKHETYEGIGAYFCVNCSRRLREMETYDINFKDIICSVKASSFRNAVFAAIEFYQLNVTLGDTFTWCPVNTEAFTNTKLLSLTESDINFIKSNMWFAAT